MVRFDVVAVSTWILSLCLFGCSDTGRSAVGDMLGEDIQTQDESAPLDLTPEDRSTEPDRTGQELLEDVQGTDLEPPDTLPVEDLVIQGCCSSDGDCPDGEFCDMEAVGSGGSGTCLPRHSEILGECWNDSHCPDSAPRCLGAAVCPCGFDCYIGTTMGHCVSSDYPCCQGDASCLPGEDCQLLAISDPSTESSKCLPELYNTDGQGECWSSADCSIGASCIGAMVCPCEAQCDMIDQKGTCQSDIWECCHWDEECYPERCIGGSMGAGGTCMSASGDLDCFDDSDCSQDTWCWGAQICSCDMNCLSAPGTCLPLLEVCCLTDSDCSPGEVCGFDHSCHEALTEPGRCWSNSDCYETQTCEGMVSCPCGTSCLVDTEPGHCSPLPSGCCFTDADCGEDQLCKAVGGLGELPGSCVPNPAMFVGCPPPGGCCWDDADCAEGTSCKDAYVCGCIELCWVCGACMEDQMGHCE